MVTSSARAYLRFLDAISVATPEGRYSPEAVQEMQAALLEALRAPEPIPSEMQLFLVDAFEHLCAGVPVPLLTPQRVKGGALPNIAATRLIAPAVRYLRWCADGRIHDPAPASTVARIYGVTTRTVGRWQFDWRDRETPPMHADWGQKGVERLMHGSAAAYRRITGREP